MIDEDGELISPPETASLFDLAAAGETLVQTLFEEFQDEDALLGMVHTQAELCLLDIKIRHRYLTAMALTKAPSEKLTELKEGIGARISQLMVLTAAIACLQSEDVSASDEDAISEYAEEWEEEYKVSVPMCCSVMSESLSSVILDGFEDNTPEEKEETSALLQEAYASLLAGCMILCQRTPLDFDAVLYNACFVSYLGEDAVKALLKSIQRKHLS